MKELKSKHLVDDKRNCIYYKKGQCTRFHTNKCIIDEGVDCPKVFCFENKWIQRRLHEDSKKRRKKKSLSKTQASAQICKNCKNCKGLIFRYKGEWVHYDSFSKCKCPEPQLYNKN